MPWTCCKCTHKTWEDGTQDFRTPPTSNIDDADSRISYSKTRPSQGHSQDPVTAQPIMFPAPTEITEFIVGQKEKPELDCARAAEAAERPGSP